MVRPPARAPTVAAAAIWFQWAATGIFPLPPAELVLRPSSSYSSAPALPRPLTKPAGSDGCAASGPAPPWHDAEPPRAEFAAVSSESDDIGVIGRDRRIIPDINRRLPQQVIEVLPHISVHFRRQ